METPGSQSTQHIVIIRKALPAEIDQIADLNKYLFDLSYHNFDASLRQSWQETSEVNQYMQAALDNPQGLFIVAVDEDKLVGYLNGKVRQMAPHREQVPAAKIENVMVLPEYQKKGIGKKMVQTFLDWCRANSIKNVSVRVYARNTNAIGFYKEFGFQDLDVTLEIGLAPAPPKKTGIQDSSNNPTHPAQSFAELVEENK